MSILSASETMRLMPQQRLSLTDIDLEFRATAVHLLSERELHRLSVQRERRAIEGISPMTAEQLQEIEGKTLELKLAWLDALNRSLDVLLPEQQAMLPARTSELPSFATDDALQRPEDLDVRIAEAIGKRVKEAKVVEIETTQAIAERLLGWAKSFGLVVGVPVALLGVVLGGLGIKGYADFAAYLSSAQKEVTESIDNARSNAKEMRTQTDELRRENGKLQEEYRGIRNSLADTRNLQAQVENLSKRVEEVDAAFDRITKETLSRFNKTVGDVQRVLKDIGGYDGEINDRLDDKTRNSIRKFQHEAGIFADGSIGPQTFRRLFKDQNN
jgi:F0F1-type ATP synthase membrane subunit b/b'